MNQSHSHILITLRDGGSLAQEPYYQEVALRRQDSSLVRVPRQTTLRDLVAIGWLREARDGDGSAAYTLTQQGSKIARSIRNRRTP